MDNQDGKSADTQPEENMEHGIPLTAAVKARIEDLEQRRIELLQKIDDLAEVGASQLDELKTKLLSEMAKAKDNINAYTQTRIERLVEISNQTQETVHRLNTAQQLVDRLEAPLRQF
ncbi:g316 [Coccomyxa elongata]